MSGPLERCSYAEGGQVTKRTDYMEQSRNRQPQGRRTTSRSTALWGVLTALIFLLVACAGGGEEVTGEVGDGTEPTAAKTPEAESTDVTTPTESEQRDVEPAELTIMSQNGTGYGTGLFPVLAADLGYLQEEALTMELIPTRQSSVGITGLLSGEAQIGLLAEGVLARAEGAPVINVGTVIGASIWSLIAQPEIASWEDLKGEDIGVSGPNTVSTAVIKQVLAEVGIDPESEVSFIAAGGGSERAAALDAGRVAAIPAPFPSQCALEEKGFTNLGLAPEGFQPPRIIVAEILVTEEWAEQNRDILVRYLRAHHRTAEYLKDESNREDAIERVSRLTDVDPTCVAATLDLYTDPNNAYLLEGFRTPEGAFENGMQAYAEFGALESPDAVDKDDYIRYEYIDEALASTVNG